MASSCLSFYYIPICVGVGLAILSIAFALFRINKALQNKEDEFNTGPETLPDTLKLRKAITVPLFIHIIDQATDIGVIFHFFLLWNDKVDCSDVSIYPFFMFIASCASFVGYRVISFGIIFSRTNSTARACSQMFDLLIYFGIDLNFEYNQNKLSNPQIFIFILESIIESFPMALIQLYFIIETGFSINNLLIIISFVFSILSLTSSLMIQHNKEYNSSVFEVKLGNVFRFFDLFYRLSVLSLIWTVLGFVALLFVLVCEFIVLSICGYKYDKLSNFYIFTFLVIGTFLFCISLHISFLPIFSLFFFYFMVFGVMFFTFCFCFFVVGKYQISNNIIVVNYCDI